MKQQQITLFHFSLFQLTKSTSNLNDVVYGGRPRDEEPHVKRTTKKKTERTEYIVRVDLVRHFHYPLLYYTGKEQHMHLPSPLPIPRASSLSSRPSERGEGRSSN